MTAPMTFDLEAIARVLDGHGTLSREDEQQLVGQCQAARDIFREIAAGQGAYSRDQLTHAANTIDAMKALAAKGVALFASPGVRHAKSTENPDWPHESVCTGCGEEWPCSTAQLFEETPQ